MPRVAKAKKTTENNKVSEEKIEKNGTTLEYPVINEKGSHQVNEIEEVLNGNDIGKTDVRTTKAAKGKKESNTKSEKSEPKTKGATKKAVSKEVRSDDDKVNEPESPKVAENKKRATKKKTDEDPEEVPAAKKRSKKEPVNNEKASEKNVDEIQSNGNKKEAPKKRGAKEVTKSEEIQKVNVSEPAKKRTKKDDEIPVVTDEKKKVNRRKNDVDKPMDEDTEFEKPPAKKSRGKVADEPKVDDPEPEKPATKQSKGKQFKKTDNKEKVPSKSTKAKEQTVTESVEAKKTKNNKKANKSEDKIDGTDDEPKSAPKKGKATKKNNKEETEKIEESKPSPKKGKGIKKTDDKVDGNVATKPTSNELEEEEKIASPKQAKGKTAAKKPEKPAQNEKKFQNSIESDLNFELDINEKWNLKIVTWNISGLRSCVDKGCVEYFKHESPDVICLNEIKCGTEKEIPEQIKLEGYHAYWNIAKGMPGVGVLTRQFPEEVFYDLPGQFSDEKRLITVEFKKYFLVCCYVVNAGRGLKTLDKRLEWNKAFDEYIKDLDKKKPVIIAGDMNVAHNEIDLANPKSNQKNAGFTKEEREGFTQLLSYGFVDTFRQLHPDEKAYTFWSYMNNARAKNVGWRLDYFIASERFMDKVKDNVIRSTVKGSDHCPLVLFLDL